MGGLSCMVGGWDPRDGPICDETGRRRRRLMRWIVVFFVMGRLSWMMMMEVEDGMELGIWRLIGWMEAFFGCIYRSICVNSTFSLPASFRWLRLHTSLYPCKSSSVAGEKNDHCT